MATKTVSIRMDEDLYREFSEFSERVYIPVSALISSFAAMTVREQRVPFDVVADPFYTPANQARISAAIDQIEAGQGTVHALIGV